MWNNTSKLLKLVKNNTNYSAVLHVSLLSGTRTDSDCLSLGVQGIINILAILIWKLLKRYVTLDTALVVESVETMWMYLVA